MGTRAGIGHIAHDFSCLDILTVLYFKIMRINPENPSWEERDRFVLSKGHSVGALYVTLAARGFFPLSWLATYQGFNTRLPGHPDRKTVPGIEHNTGALGHGFSVAVGMAAGLYDHNRKNNIVPHVYVLLGDGELQEGSNWEAAMLGAHLQLSNLTAIVDRNGLQQGNFTEETVRLESLRAKWESFGWATLGCNGHDFADLVQAFNESSTSDNQPQVIIAKTIKGCGVGFMENQTSWHHRIPTQEEFSEACKEIKKNLALQKGFING